MIMVNSKGHVQGIILITLFIGRLEIQVASRVRSICGHPFTGSVCFKVIINQDNMRGVMRNQTMWFSHRFNTNRSVH